MYLVLQGHIEITDKNSRSIHFYSFNSIEIERDIFKINSTCKIKIPTSARLKYKGKIQEEKVQSAKEFQRGDRIKVWLGYNGELKEEFSGFITRINYTTPLEIECEGYEFLLRSSCETKTWMKTTLKEVVKYLIQGTEIKLCENIPAVEFDKLIIPANATRLGMLQEIKTKYGLVACFNADNLYVGLAYGQDFGKVKYSLGWNTIKDNELKYRNADDVRLKVKAICIKKDNTKIEAEIGDKDGSLRTLHFYNITGKAELERIAKEEIQKYKYSGYEGKITTFLVPFVCPGMKAVVDDPKYEERKGTYYVTSVKVRADTGGGRRTVQFTIKL